MPGLSWSTDTGAFEISATPAVAGGTGVPETGVFTSPTTVPPTTNPPTNAAPVADAGPASFDLVTTGGGITAQAGLTLTYQSRNRAIVFAKPHGNRQRFLDAAGNEVSQLATVIGLWNFNAAPNWEIRIDDRKVETLPQRATSIRLSSSSASTRACSRCCNGCRRPQPSLTSR